MAEEKKPKIDLKARLGKGGGATPPPAGVGGGGVPGAMPSPGAPMGVPPPAAMPQSNPQPGGLPVPPGIPVGPPPAFRQPTPQLDPSNPLAAVVAPQQRAVPSRPPAPPQPQRIEVDEMAVQEARKGARKQGLIAGLVAALVLGAIGYIAGGASSESKARAASVNHAKSLATDVSGAREKLKTMADKVEAGRNQLLKEKKFPNDLAKDLGAINVDFDGSKLAGVRFSGFSSETTNGLIEFISLVQQTNDRKGALQNLLSKLQKPITEQLNPQGPNKVSFVVILDKDQSKQEFAILAPLAKPLEQSGNNPPTMPAEVVATNPLTRGNVTIPKATTFDKPGAAYVIPKSVEAACPSESSGQIAQLGGQLNKIITDIRGETMAAGGDAVVDNKDGLLQKADKLVTNLNKVQ
jgi:hypothetical protein